MQRCQKLRWHWLSHRLARHEVRVQDLPVYFWLRHAWFRYRKDLCRRGKDSSVTYLCNADFVKKSYGIYSFSINILKDYKFLHFQNNYIFWLLVWSHFLPFNAKVKVVKCLYFSCGAFKVCPYLGSLTDGSIQQEGIAIGDTATYVCDVGYDVMLSSSAVNPRVCQADGTWTGDDNGYSCSPIGE